ncbi:MAG: DUF2750 domain-containing protein [Clostridia bacterium]|nr:DUF2750 domain-containing protein [Clostridia bacterium]
MLGLKVRGMEIDMEKGKEFQDIFNVPPKKRYKYFVEKAADNGEVWMLNHKRLGCQAFEDEKNIYLRFWPTKDFAECFKYGGEVTQAVEIQEFCDILKMYYEESEQEAKKIMFHIFPNEHDAYTIDSYTLYCDIMDALNKRV